MHIFKRTNIRLFGLAVLYQISNIFTNSQNLANFILFVVVVVKVVVVVVDPVVVVVVDPVVVVVVDPVVVVAW